jgi:uncharacterized protein (TIGR02996 family)
MDIEQAVLQAIHDNPTDETSWLVLADWLEEQGQTDRAEMVRLHRSLRGLLLDNERRPLEKRFHRMLLAGVRPCVPVLRNSIGMELALIPPGSFWLGSPDNEDGRYQDESPRRLIELTCSFYLGVCTVTQDEYRRVTGTSPSAFSPSGRQSEAVAGLDTSRFPVEDITWADANAFCKALSRLPAERQAGRSYRLPTEVEWEYACRGGAAFTTPFPYGKTLNSDLANFKDNAHRSKKKRPGGRTTEVGSYLPNGFGLYDMVGNIWEWCSDWYASEAYAAHPPKDPRPAREGDRRNARGGPWHLELRRVRCADRSSFEPEYHDSDCGLRVLCEHRKKKARKSAAGSASPPVL